MAKKPAAAPSEPAAAQPETAFVDLMMAAADYVKSCGGLEPAKKSLEDAAHFIGQAGSAAKASKALEVLASLREKISV